MSDGKAIASNNFKRYHDVNIYDGDTNFVSGNPICQSVSVDRLSVSQLSKCLNCQCPIDMEPWYSCVSGIFQCITVLTVIYSF